MKIKGRHEFERRPTFNDVGLATEDDVQTGVSGHADLTNNPHGVTKGQVGLANVDNKSSATILSELTGADITSKLGFTPEDSANKGVANGYAALDAAGHVPANQLPSYVDDVLEFSNLASFPITGETGKIYVALDTNKTYRWSGTTYIFITSGAVDSVAGKTGVVTLVKADVGLSNVDNTSDASKNSAVATLTNKTMDGGTY